MPVFKTTQNILKNVWEDEVFDENWMNQNHLFLPETSNWDYSRELKIEDVDIWEVIYFEGGNRGVYASWKPYAEFYMITLGITDVRTFYGKGALKKVINIMDQMNWPYAINKIWVENEDMWLYS